jgi:hypothetical protein
MKEKIKICLTDIIDICNEYDRDIVNSVYDEYLGMDLLNGVSNYILSGHIWELMSLIYGLKYSDSDYERFHDVLYSVCRSMGIGTEFLGDDDVPFYIWLPNG